MKNFLTLAFIVALAFLPALAQAQDSQESGKVTGTQESNVPTDIGAPESVILEVEDVKAKGTMKQRKALSQKMHEIWPIRRKVENALDSISERIDENNRAKFKAGMRRAIDFEELEEASIQAMADIYSVAELEKMIDFYGSKEGRSISVKTGDYEKQLQPLMIKMVDKALLDAKMGTQSSTSSSRPLQSRPR